MSKLKNVYNGVGQPYFNMTYTIIRNIQISHQVNVFTKKMSTYVHNT